MRILYSVSFYLPPPSSPEILIFPSDLNIPAEEEWWWKRLGRDHFVHFAKNSIWTISAIDGAPQPRINRDRTQQNGGNSSKIRILHSVVRSFPRFPRSNKLLIYLIYLIYLYRFDESKDILFFLIWKCLSLRVLKIVEGIKNVLFCFAGRERLIFERVVGGSVAEGQRDAQEARITPARFSSSIFANSFSLFPRR